MTTSKYPILSQLVIAGPAILGASFVIIAGWLASTEPLTLLVGGVGLIAIFVTIFQLPVGLILSPETVTVLYLGGFTQSFDRQHLRARIIGFAPGTLHVTATDPSWRSRLIGSFKVNLAFISEREQLLRELGVPDPLDR